MTIITAVQKRDQVAIACDTQSSGGGIKYTAAHLINPNKLITYGHSVFGLSGSTAIHQVFEDLLINTEPANLTSRLEIFRWLLSHHKILKDNYYINTNVGIDQEQPVDSTWATALIANPYGIFSINKYRSVFEYSKFWAIGSGGTLALGAMDILYEQDLTAGEIAEAGALTATKFNMTCAPPILVETMNRAADSQPKTSMVRKSSARRSTKKSTKAKKATTRKQKD